MADEVDELRAIERERMNAFVAKDVPALQRLHADGYALINPGGQELTRDEYINGIALGFIEYRVWEPQSDMEVRLYGDAAVLRYRCIVEVAVQGEGQPAQRYWHTDVYEKRDGQWQAVRSQQTRIST